MTRSQIWAKVPRYLRRLIIGFDEFGNVILNGLPSETISSRLGRNVLEGEYWSTTFFAPFVDFIFGKDHCVSSIERLQKHGDIKKK